jgi:hypothetical protein
MTIHPHLVSLSIPKFDVGRYSPPDSQIFAEWIDLEIEASDNGRVYGGESFGVNVCSLRWMAQRVIEAGTAWGRGQLVVARWDINLIRAQIESLCEESAAADWNGVVARLSRYLIVDTIDFSPY